MPYVHVEDFRRGLDLRRSESTAPVGSLRKCLNAHITRGGEVEKRQAFSLIATVSGAVHGLHTIGDQVHVFGSDAEPSGLPSTVVYQRLQHKDGSTAMSRVLSVENFNGKPYVIAEFDDGAVYHYYDGQRVTAWDTISSDVSDNDGVAALLATKVDGESSYSASATNNVVTVTGPENGYEFSYDGEAIAGASGSDDTQSLDVAVAQFAVADEDEVLATGSFRITGGTKNIGANQVGDVFVDGVSILANPVDWETSNSNTAAAVATEINNTSSAPDYSASSDGDKVIIEAMPGTGSDPNGFNVTTSTNGDVQTTDHVDMEGGRDEQIGQPQIIDATVGGTFEPSDQYKLTLQDPEDSGSDIVFTVRGDAAGTGRTSLTFQDKMYSVTQSLLYFSGLKGDPPLPDPTAWGDSVTGAGFISMATQQSGANDLTALGIYQDWLAVFSQASVQLWSMDVDPDQNQHIQTLPNLGTSAPDTVQTYGNEDVFFLAKSGVRSLRARNSSNLANAEDVGSPIDPDLVEYMQGLDPAVRDEASSGLEPSTSRYWLAIGSRFYVFSRFPGSDISAWSKYDVGDDVIAVSSGTNAIYIRTATEIYRYGPASGQGTEYAQYQVEVKTPFMDGAKPGHLKQLHSIDMDCEGQWQVFVHPDPSNPDYYEDLGVVEGTTFGLQARLPVLGNSTHFAFRFVSDTSFYAKLSSFIFHYSGGEDG